MRRSQKPEACPRIHAVGGRGMRPAVLESPKNENLRERWRELIELKRTLANAQTTYNRERSVLLAMGCGGWDEARSGRRS